MRTQHKFDFTPQPSDKVIWRKLNITPVLSDLPENFRKRVKLQPPRNNRVTTDCWIWKKSLNDAGYGRVDWKGLRHRMAHRVVYEIFYGPVPHGLEVDHLCSAPACVNPTHLEAVTRLENIRRSHTVGFGNGTRTHCRQGHAFTPRNIYRWRGKRFCLKCQGIRQAKWLEHKAKQAVLA